MKVFCTKEAVQNLKKFNWCVENILFSILATLIHVPMEKQTFVPFYFK